MINRVRRWVFPGAGRGTCSEYPTCSRAAGNESVPDHILVTAAAAAQTDPALRADSLVVSGVDDARPGTYVEARWACQRMGERDRSPAGSRTRLTIGAIWKGRPCSLRSARGAALLLPGERGAIPAWGGLLRATSWRSDSYGSRRARTLVGLKLLGLHDCRRARAEQRRVPDHMLGRMRAPASR